jgi:16S rRNA processing protein RimM
VGPEAERPDEKAGQDGTRGAPHKADRWLRAGVVGRPHGLDGSFHVRDPTPALPDQGAKVVVGGRDRTIVRRAGDEQRPIVRLADCEDREAAEALRGEPLMVPRAEAPELEEEEWWEEDLVGCQVRDGEAEVGTVRRLLGLPSVDVLEVARGEGEADLLVPLVSDAVRSVDIERRLIDIDLRFLGAE